MSVPVFVEDMQTGFRIDGLEIVNPFAAVQS